MGGDYMPATRKDKIDDILREMDDYIQSFKIMPNQQAKQKAKESLIRSGVITRSGNDKMFICK